MAETMNGKVALVTGGSSGIGRATDAPAPAIGRLGRAEEVPEAVIWLCSENP